LYLVFSAVVITMPLSMYQEESQELRQEQEYLEHAFQKKIVLTEPVKSRKDNYKKIIQVEATAYCPGTPGSGCPTNSQGHAQCTGPYNDGYTKSGSQAKAGDGSIENPHIIAADPAVLPLGSLVYLDGYGYAMVEDIGGSIRGKRIDLLFNYHEEALEFGRRDLKVYALE
jgi:3D (Asp-Asp-Asp) domain-containing protein